MIQYTNNVFEALLLFKAVGNEVCMVFNLTLGYPADYVVDIHINIFNNCIKAW